MSLISVKQTTDKNQAYASDPSASAWVSANAGTGKTYVLVQRVLRLLLAGTDPERILCLTFTKASASEMSNRLFARLSRWAIMEDAELKTVLGDLLGHQPASWEILQARRLFARALETPGGLKVQTIHAFCERLLQRFPLEAGIAPHFSVLDEEAHRELLRQSTDRVLAQAAKPTSSPLGRALKTVISRTGEDRFDEILRSVLSDREQLRNALRLLQQNGTDTEAVALVMRDVLGIHPDVSKAELVEQLANILSNDEIDRAVIALQEGKKTDCDIAAHLARARKAVSIESRRNAFAIAFLTTTGKARSDRRFITRQIREDSPDIASILVTARDRYHSIAQELTALYVADASSALILLADAIMQDYEQSKATRAALDFDDLILKTSDLLLRSDAAAWVLYKLDGGIDHILVDEAQDTSPKAWRVIDRLAEEFFSGEGARTITRTVFAVGDEKQSIYGFQGAEPKKFAEMGTNLRQKAKLAGREWHQIPLTLSFRSTSPILKSVDMTFGDREALQGVTAGGDAILHHAYRQGHAGHVEIWNTEKPAKSELTDPWQPFDDLQSDAPIHQLANRIADEIKNWLDSKKHLESCDRPIEPGDILILVRKREPFAAPMIRALKARQIPVSGADRMKITEQLGVMDLMALGDFLLMPEDDLALATLLKSPLFDFTDDDLFDIGYGRRIALWDALKFKKQERPHYADAFKTLRRWRARADLAPPYEFYAGLLIESGRRESMIAKLGPEAGDAIDEFLNMALSYDEMAPPSLQGFIEWMRLSGTEIKRDMEQDRNEVRIMTVHGAKGLEANIVFMPDTCSRRGNQRDDAVLSLAQRQAPTESPSHLIWAIPGSKQLSAVIEAREEKRKAERDEYHRLLYVAMTRARDQLYVCGFENKTGRDDGCWYDLIKERLSDELEEQVDPEGRTIWKISTPQREDPNRLRDISSQEETAVALPDWAEQRAPKEPIKAIPISPSMIIPLDPEEIEDIEKTKADEGQTVLPPGQLVSQNRFLRGQLTHTLLQHLPLLPQDRQEVAAKNLVKARGTMASEKMQDEIVTETLAILRHPDFAPLFGPESQAEVPVTAQIPPSKPGGTPLRITGEIDRLAILENEILIIDYKTNRPPPDDPQGVVPAYLAQLAAYRMAIRHIFQEKPIRCGILWTDGPRIMEIPSSLLDAHEQDLLQKG